MRNAAAADREQRDGAAGDSEELCSAEYWVRQVRSPVRFLDGVRVLEEEGARACLELGPDGVLTAMAAGCLSDASQMQVVAAQRRERDGAEALLAALGVLHCMVLRWTGRRCWERAPAGRLLRFRPMRSSGSAIGWRLRRRAATSRRWGSGRRSICTAWTGVRWG